MNRERKGPIGILLHPILARPENPRIPRYREELRADSQTILMLEAVFLGAVRKVGPNAAALLLAQKPLPRLNVLGRNKATGAVIAWSVHQRNSKVNVVHRQHLQPYERESYPSMIWPRVNYYEISFRDRRIVDALGLLLACSRPATPLPCILM